MPSTRHRCSLRFFLRATCGGRSSFISPGIICRPKHFLWEENGNAAAPWARPARAGAPSLCLPAAAGRGRLLRKRTRVRGAQRWPGRRGTPLGRGRAFVRRGCFPRARRVEEDAQVCSEAGVVAPGRCTGTQGWAVSAALGLGNFWPIGPAPLGPSRPAAPQAQRVKQVPRPARRYWPRAGAARPRPPRSAEPNLGSRGGRGGHSSPGCRARALAHGERKGGEKEMGKPTAAAAKRVGGGSAREERGSSPLSRRGWTLRQQLRSWLATRKKEGGSGATGGPGQGVGETIHSHRPHPLIGREGVQVTKKAHPNRKHPPHSLKNTRVTMWRSNWETGGNKCTCFLFLFPWWLEFSEFSSVVASNLFIIPKGHIEMDHGGGGGHTRIPLAGPTVPPRKFVQDQPARPPGARRFPSYKGNKLSIAQKRPPRLLLHTIPPR